MSYRSRRNILKALNNPEEDGWILDGTSYDGGALEDVEGTARSCARVLVALIKHLIQKKLLSKREAVDIIFEFPTVAWDDFDPSDEELL